MNSDTAAKEEKAAKNAEDKKKVALIQTRLDQRWGQSAAVVGAAVFSAGDVRLVPKVEPCVVLRRDLGKVLTAAAEVLRELKDFAGCTNVDTVLKSVALAIETEAAIKEQVVHVGRTKGERQGASC